MAHKGRGSHAAGCQNWFSSCFNTREDTAFVMVVLVWSIHSSAFKSLHFDNGANSFPLAEMTRNDDGALADRVSFFQGNKTGA